MSDLLLRYARTNPLGPWKAVPVATNDRVVQPIESRSGSHHTLPPPTNEIVERDNRVLGVALRTLFLNRGQGDWDLMLPQLLRAFRGTPHAGTGETAIMLMLG